MTSPHTPSASAAAPAAGSRQWAGLAVLTVAVTLLAVDGTVLALAIPALSAALEPTATQMLWIGDIYSFAIAGLLITMGNLADRIGRKKLLLIGSVGFGLASALAAFAPSASLLIAARALLGMSGATIMPSTLSIVRQMFPRPAERTRAIAIWSAGATGGAVLGPLVGGALLEHLWWGSVFLINIPIMLIVLISGVLLLDESRNPHPGGVDLLSSALSILTIVPLVYALKRVFSTGIDGQVATALAVGIIAGLVFLRRQRRLTLPMIDVTLFTRPAFTGAVAAMVLSIFALSGLLFFFSQYLQLVRGYSPLIAGLAELPATVASISVVFFIGLLVARCGVGRSIGLGLGFGAAGLLGLALAEGLTSYLWMGCALALTGFGVSVSMTLATDAVVASAPKERAGAASSISETAYELGVALGIAVLGSVLTALYRHRLPALEGLSEAQSAAVEDSLAAGVNALHGTHPEALLAIQQSFTVAMQITAVTAAVLLLIAAITAWRVIPVRLDPHDTRVDDDTVDQAGDITSRETTPTADSATVATSTTPADNQG